MTRTPEEINYSAMRISRRALLVGALQLSVVGGLAARMRYLQIDQAEEFRTLAEENRINETLLAPARGLIFDRAGRPVAKNVPNYKLVMKRENVPDVDATLADLQKLIYIDPFDMQDIQQKLVELKRFQDITLVENMTWEDFAKVAANAPSLPGIEAEVGLSRVYPQRGNLAHVVGYVGPVSEYNLSRIENPDPLLKLDRFQFGKTQVEAKMEETLRGSAGTRRIEVNAAGRVMRELGRIEGESGKDLTISVDTKLQNYALARMDGQSASAVVIDIETGDILSIGSTPFFDPNLFVRGISNRNYNALTGDKFGPLRAKAVQGTYAPASTFKMIVALAALEAGVMRPNETVRCNGHLDVSGNRFHCWKGYGHGRMNLQQSLMQSCDIYYYTIAQRVGINKITEMAKKFGLGVRHDIPLSAVRQGNMPDRAWKQRVHNNAWLIGDTVNASIGQGYLLASPLQLAVMAARLGSGRMVTPRLIRRVEGIEQPVLGGEDIDVDPKNLALVQRAMYGVSNIPGGTAFRQRLLPDDMTIAGKTGTSQVRRITAAERAAGVTKNADLPWERRDHALFVNYAPYDNPRVAVAVVVEHGGSGGAVAAPIARDITAFALGGKVPDLEAYPPEIRNTIKVEQEELIPKLADFDNPGQAGSDRA